MFTRNTHADADRTNGPLRGTGGTTRRRLVQLLGVGAVVGLSGCARSGGEENPTDAGTETGTETETENGFEDDSDGVPGGGGGEPHNPGDNSDPM